MRSRGGRAADRAAAAPLRRLSVHLLSTYKHINEAYYAAKHKRRRVASQQQHRPQQQNAQQQEERAYIYPVQKGEVLGGEDAGAGGMYAVLSLLGRGSFGCVVRARDAVHGREVAVKIVQSRPGFLERAKAEAELVAFVNAADAGGHHRHAVRLLDQMDVDDAPPEGPVAMDVDEGGSEGASAGSWDSDRASDGASDGSCGDGGDGASDGSGGDGGSGGDSDSDESLGPALGSEEEDDEDDEDDEDEDEGSDAE